VSTKQPVAQPVDQADDGVPRRTESERVAEPEDPERRRRGRDDVGEGGGQVSVRG